MASEFEYLVRPHPATAYEDRQHVLNGLGAHGWELVAVTTGDEVIVGDKPEKVVWLYFKRRKG